MKHVIKFNGEELINKSEAIKILGFSQLRSIDYFIERENWTHLRFWSKKEATFDQVEAFKAKRGYSNG